MLLSLHKPGSRRMKKRNAHLDKVMRSIQTFLMVQRARTRVIREWSLSNVTGVYERRFLLRPTGLEVRVMLCICVRQCNSLCILFCHIHLLWVHSQLFFHDSSSAFFAFLSQTEHKVVLQRISGLLTASPRPEAPFPKASTGNLPGLGLQALDHSVRKQWGGKHFTKPAASSWKLMPPSSLPDIQGWTEAWMKREMSNLDYLLLLNR